MKPQKKLCRILLFVAVFVVTFAAVFLAVALTQTANAMPPRSTLSVDGMSITLGPPPNTTNVPLDTTITVDALATAPLNDLQLFPPVPIARIASESTGPLTYQSTFYPAEPLEPATAYTVSVTIEGTPVSWTFTTTSEPFKPSISYFLATNAFWIALSAAALAIALAGFVAWFRVRRKQV